MNTLQMLELIYKAAELASLPKGRHVDVERCYIALEGYLKEQIKREEEAVQKEKEEKESAEQTIRESIKERVPGQMRP